MRKKLLSIIALGGLALVLIAYLLPRQAANGSLENIQGIPYPPSGQGVTILEPLAHMDVHVRNVLARQLILTFTFIPENETQLSVGVRENSFWLSYNRHIFYEASSDGLPTTQARQVSVTFPLTDKLLDQDDTVDIMFFAGNDDAIALSQTTTSSHVRWEISDMYATTAITWPSAGQIKDYLRAILTQERPI